MDFYRNGRVSCFEFQEVVHGQEKYCDLKVARELFLLLARGTDGCLTWADFCAGLSSASNALCSDHDGEDCQSRGSWGSCGTSDTSSSAHAAGIALRSLLFGQNHTRDGNMHEDDAQKTGVDVDEMTTTVQSLTSRSSHSCPAVFSTREQHGLPHNSSDMQHNSAIAAFLGDTSAEANIAIIPTSIHMGPESPPNLPTPKVVAASSDVQLPGVADAANQVPEPQREVRNALRGGANEITRWLLDGTTSNEPDVLQTLDDSLLAWRAEVAALKEFASGCGIATHTGAAQRALVAYDDQAQRLTEPCSFPLVAHAALDECNTIPARAHRVAPASMYIPSDGLKWLQLLPFHTQGRLAACCSMDEALEVLDEALDGFPAPESANERRIEEIGPSAPPGRRGRWGRGRVQNDSGRSCEAPSALRSRIEEASLVTASAELLRNSQARVTCLQKDFHERQQKHEQHVAELCKQFRHERRRGLHCILERISPPQRVRSHRASPQKASPSYVTPAADGGLDIEADLEHNISFPLVPNEEVLPWDDTQPPAFYDATAKHVED